MNKHFLPSKSMTIGTFLDSSRTASLDGFVVDVEVVVETVVVTISSHSYNSQGHPALQFA